MVRLVVTDFQTKEDNETFYLNDEFDISQKMFTYDSFKKHSVYLSKYEVTNTIYSLNLLSRKYLNKNQLLVHITDSEYFILFNHKTVYSAKINQNFITDDIIKSILITKHIAMLSSGGSIKKYYYVISSKYKSAVENILKQNTKNEKNEEIAYSLGNVEELVKPLNELDTFKSHSAKNIFVLFFVILMAWVMFFGLEQLTKKYIYKEPLEKLKREIKIEKRLIQRQKILLNRTNKKYKELTDCITPIEVKND
ncbi:hypothetical protein LPB137_00675 [Poseidonibacter parvus]|uniref:Uncharacterized protein n=1 Tax=Poseidonibacter parvus TaxID=1850254 RepID=A0A1P8KIS0_9BACT|nr:hypothetical protein [Poseidonibacter parvus]APW64450.1 hypothetical protein LPB137_00675 [Poseidonibacter parvus]